eukprot:TRINITY_DN113102_c0_g1_i1.p1 TRINITY_DN113102_c0_g1~~TRINITY_DN113102_c0_g1_i1.p1  ORF type:complete len:586 (-),score=134.34 TRINITY_DN113102_c0_g1_i1:185-1942(-)
MKRQSDGGASDAKRAATGGGLSRPGRYGFKVLCPGQLAREVLGDRGSNVHNIEEETRTHIQFSGRDDFYPDTTSRVCSVSANEIGDIMGAMGVLLDHVIQFAEQERPDLNGHYGDFADQDEDKIVFRAALHKVTTGAVIGPKGENIRRLRDSSGAYVEVSRDAIDNHQMVTMVGARDQVMSVLDDLNNIVQADSEQPWFIDWVRQKAVSASGPRTGKGGKDLGKGGGGKGKDFDRGGGGPKPENLRAADEHEGCTIFVGRLAQATSPESLRSYFSTFGEVAASDVRMDKKTGRSKGFGFVTFANRYAIDACFEAEEHTIDGRRVDVKQYGDTGSGRIDRDGGFEDEAPEGRPHDSEEGRDRWNRGDDDGWRQEGGERGWEQEDGGGYEAEGHSPEWFADLAGTVPTEYMDLDYCITCQMPSQKIGALIGARGAIVTEVERVSGAQVSIEQKRKGDPGSDTHRTVTIVGKLIACYGAHMMLMKAYNDAEAERAKSEEAAADREARDKVEALQRQIAELSRQVEQVKETTTPRTTSSAPLPPPRPAKGGGGKGDKNMSLRPLSSSGSGSKGGGKSSGKKGKSGGKRK